MSEKIYYDVVLDSMALSDMPTTEPSPSSVFGFTVCSAKSVTPMKLANWSTPDVLPLVNWESPESASITEHLIVTFTADP